ncbi:Eukaryotic translation initiation factor 4E transporter [Nymphon striatum]|nr:Eukaryotic translation initiation factor 4E transporter [Nymphon striatum]KAG1656158.1 Eukaryotic translation initiation factor 4E transporter [Nymphon striatum]
MSMAKSEQPKTESEVDFTENIIEDIEEHEPQEETEPEVIEVNEDDSKKLQKLTRFQYDRRFMIDLSKNPICLKRPSCLSADHLNGNGIWDPEKWFREKHSGSPVLSEEGQMNKRPMDHDGRESKKRITDPKERIKEEMQDDIILSPQRRSFGTGCHVINQRRLGSPVDVHDVVPSKDSVMQSRESSTRRIGSGRLGNRNNPDRQESDREYGYRPPAHRDFNNRFRDKEHDKNKRHDRGGRYMERLHAQEPEWYSDGPASQSEFIELRGFDEPTENGEERKSPPTNNRRDLKKTSTPSGPKHENINAIVKAAGCVAFLLITQISSSGSGSGSGLDGAVATLCMVTN